MLPLNILSHEDFQRQMFNIINIDLFGHCKDIGKLGIQILNGVLLRLVIRVLMYYCCYHSQRVYFC